MTQSSTIKIDYARKNAALKKRVKNIKTIQFITQLLIPNDTVSKILLPCRGRWSKRYKDTLNYAKLSMLIVHENV